MGTRTDMPSAFDVVWWVEAGTKVWCVTADFTNIDVHCHLLTIEIPRTRPMVHFFDKSLVTTQNRGSVFVKLHGRDLDRVVRLCEDGHPAVFQVDRVKQRLFLG